MSNDFSREQRASALANVLRQWLIGHPNWNQARDANGWWRQRTPGEIAEDLVAPIEEMDVELAGVLESPDGRLVQEVAAWLLPTWPAELVQLFADSVLLAAQARNRDQKIRAGLYATASLLMAAVLILMMGEVLGRTSRS